MSPTQVITTAKAPAGAIQLGLSYGPTLHYHAQAPLSLRKALPEVPYLNNVVYTPHAVRRMDERSIEEARVYEALQNGEIIEEYDTDEERRYLIMHRDESDSIYSTSGLKVLTVPSVIHVAAADQAIGRTVVITAYDPREGPGEWDDDYKTRL